MVFVKYLNYNRVTNTRDLIQRQIDQIPSLRELPNSESPQFKQWEQVTRAIIENKLGKVKADNFPSSFEFWPHRVGPWYEEELKESLQKGLDKAQAFLNGIIEQIDLLGEGNPVRVFEEGSQSKNTRYGNIVVSGGTVILGDGNKITQVAVRELMQAIEEEIKDKAPEGENKQKILNGIKEITENETFASVAGTVLGEILRRVVRD